MILTKIMVSSSKVHSGDCFTKGKLTLILILPSAVDNVFFCPVLGKKSRGIYIHSHIYVLKTSYSQFGHL